MNKYIPRYIYSSWSVGSLLWTSYFLIPAWLHCYAWLALGVLLLCGRVTTRWTCRLWSTRWIVFTISCEFLVAERSYVYSQLSRLGWHLSDCCRHRLDVRSLHVTCDRVFTTFWRDFHSNKTWSCRSPSWFFILHFCWSDRKVAVLSRPVRHPANLLTVCGK